MKIMKKTDVLRHIVSILLILTLITSGFVNLPLSVFAEDTGVTGGNSNIVNGSFEEPADYRIQDLAKETPSCYIYALQSNVPGWNTTSTTSRIELGWINNNASIEKASPHMKPTVAKASYTADGYQLAEVIATETNSSLYQKIAVNENASYNWTVNHRGRSDVDTLALIITDNAGDVYDKSSNSATDHFSQILNWLKNTKGVTAPADGDTATYTVYTTNLTDNSSFYGDVADWFSDRQDKNHTVKFEIHLISTGTNRWGEYTGSYTSDKNKEILFVLSSFETSYSKSDGGNLIDKMSFGVDGGNNLLINPSFDDVNANGNYRNFPAANAATPTEGIGWCTTSYARVVEIGNFEKGNAYNISAIAEVYNKPYIRDEDVNGDGVVDENDGNVEELGKQFAELNADEESSLYQIVNTDPGKMYKWSLSHRGRDAIDTMALIIGPAQFNEQGDSILPKKTSANASDQLMQISDWLYSQTDMPLQLPTNGGCSDKIKVYTPKFNSNGGWTEKSNIFSFYKDSTHTEEWYVWVIASENDKWHDYGELDTDATYNYECVIPEGQENTIFGFVSHSSYKADGTKNGMSYGNLLDNIAFKEYYYAKVEVSMNNSHGSAYITSGDEEHFIQDDASSLNGWALQGGNVTVHVKTTDRDFIGAYINGVFYPNSGDDNIWEYDAVKKEYHYTFTSVQSAIKVNIIFSAKQIYYDSRCPNEYQYKAETIDEVLSYTGGPEVQMSKGGLTEYTSHAPEEDDGWKFIGWNYINPKDSSETIFNAVHTVTLVGDGTSESPQTFKVEDSSDHYVDGISYDEGITFLGEWMYRQRAISQTYDKDQSQYFTSTDGGTVDIAVSYGAGETATDYNDENDKPVGKEIYASADDTYVTVTAKHKTGFTFNGWYDKDGKLISKNSNYVYKVNAGTIKTLYAHFDPAGCNLRLNCSTYSTVSEDINRSFKIYCSFTDLRAGKLYSLSLYESGSLSNKTFEAGANGKATVVLDMKHGDYAEFIYLPEGCQYTIEADDTSSAGFGVKGEVTTNKTLIRPIGSQEEIPVITEHIIFCKASQSALLKDGKHYEGIADGEDEITITKNSSYTFQVETRYNPSIYEDLSASLCFYGSNGDAKNFTEKTRILMIDLSNSASPKYYSYTVSGQTSAITLTEFTRLGTVNNNFTLSAADSMVTENLVFVVDYVDTANAAESGKVSLVYDDANSEINNLINPTKKAVNIGKDTTGIIADVGDGKASSNGPFAINITVSESNPAINTTYKEDDFTENSKYSVKLSLGGDKQLPDGSYAEVDGNKYFLNNGYIKIPSLTSGACKVSVYTPVPIELSDGKVKFNLALSDAVSASPAIPDEISTTVEFTCVEVAMDADVVDKVLNPGKVSAVDVTLKYIGVDEVKLNISKKNSNQTFSAILENVTVNLPNDENSFEVTLGNNFTSVSGETYIFSFIGYVNGTPVLEDKCCVVGGYVSK